MDERNVGRFGGLYLDGPPLFDIRELKTPLSVVVVTRERSLSGEFSSVLFSPSVSESSVARALTGEVARERELASRLHIMSPTLETSLLTSSAIRVPFRRPLNLDSGSLLSLLGLREDELLFIRRNRFPKCSAAVGESKLLAESDL